VIVAQLVASSLSEPANCTGRTRSGSARTGWRVEAARHFCGIGPAAGIRGGSGSHPSHREVEDDGLRVGRLDARRSPWTCPDSNAVMPLISCSRTRTARRAPRADALHRVEDVLGVISRFSGGPNLMPFLRWKRVRQAVLRDLAEVRRGSGTRTLPGAPTTWL